MSFEYFKRYFEALNLTYLFLLFNRNGIGTLFRWKRNRLSRLHRAISLSLSW